MPGQVLSQLLLCLSQQDFRWRRATCLLRRPGRPSRTLSRLAPAVVVARARAAPRVRVRAEPRVPLLLALLARARAEGPVLSPAAGVVAVVFRAAAGVAAP